MGESLVTRKWVLSCDSLIDCMLPVSTQLESRCFHWFCFPFFFPFLLFLKVGSQGAHTAQASDVPCYHGWPCSFVSASTSLVLGWQACAITPSTDPNFQRTLLSYAKIKTEIWSGWMSDLLTKWKQPCPWNVLWKLSAELAEWTSMWKSCFNLFLGISGQKWESPK